MWGFFKRIRLKSTACKCLLAVGLGLAMGVARGQTVAEVKVLWQRQVGGSVTTLLETTGYTNEQLASPALATVSGYRFTHWEVSPSDTPNFVNRNRFGRALKKVRVMPKENTTLTAVYESLTMDCDADGIADADEIYWYGSLTQTGTSDTDHDGYTFAQELQYGLDPHLPNALVYGGIRHGDSAIFWYNPHSYSPYTIQANPANRFTPITGYLKPGEKLMTKSYATDSTFGYWTLDGARQANRFGRAAGRVTLVGDGNPDHEQVATAYFFNDADKRNVAYWYGPEADVTKDSDTDGDGYTFAQELQYGLNPHLPNQLVYGGVRHGDSSTFWYNPNTYSPYTIQANPATQFAPITGFLKVGERLTTKSYTTDQGFGYWTLNGVRQANRFGRAAKSITLVGDGNPDNEQIAIAHFIKDADARQQAYWYGPDANITAESDTDGDGYTLAQEIQYGLNPHLPNALVFGGVRYGDSAVHEVNLQPFDMGVYTLVNGEVVELFATINSLTGELSGGFTFSSAVAPAVADVNGDGLKDIILASPKSVTLCQNIGAEGSPDFKILQDCYSTLLSALQQMMRPVLCCGLSNNTPVFAFCDQGGEIAYYDLSTDTIIPSDVVGYPVWSATAGWGVLAPTGDVLVLGETSLTLNVSTANATSATLADINLDGVDDLLVADAEGRIALYLRDNDTFVLQHRVWGGSYAGFATGLALAAIDWESDGDMDAIAGTADGHLLLLRDPGVGRPTNLKGIAGYDNVLLTWNPNTQSRVSGYKVYRSPTAATTFGTIAETPLPTYRDTPPSISKWDYQVTTLSRQWLSGHSEPEIVESLPSDTVTVNLGGVKLETPESLSSYDNQTIDLPIHLSNTVGLRGNGTTFTVTYDAALLELVTIKTTAISEKLNFATVIADADWTVSATSGTIEPGAGPFVSFVFKVKEGATGSTTLRVTKANFFAQNGSVVETNALPLVSTLTIQQQELPTPPNAVPPWTNGDCDGDGLVTWDDYDCAMEALKTYHRPVRPSKHTANGVDVKIHNSICAALGYSAGASLTLADGPKFGTYIEQLIGPRSK